ncbi:phosphopantetheine-binding protein [Streptomyces lavendofoliae]|uniref:phosphopantetheine-binding protein n=1 Tax=Streptomyces lavendofoliae TaxID=67314 RepID=UPI003D8E1F77
MPELPLTPNGKLDPTQLPPPTTHSTTAETPGTPDDTTTQLTHLWQQLLNTPTHPDANFFELGGNSLLAVRLHRTLRNSGYPTLQLRDLYRDSSLTGMAGTLRSIRESTKETFS